MVNVTNGANVYVRLGALKFFLRHCFSSIEIVQTRVSKAPASPFAPQGKKAAATKSFAERKFGAGDGI
jgi:hypothetical protein